MGKTTAAGKLALYLKRSKKSVLLVATDVYRPAAIDQLVKLGATIDVPVFELGTQVRVRVRACVFACARVRVQLVMMLWGGVGWGVEA